MGAYLTKPVTTTFPVDESADKLCYGASSMQGWRIKQEDAHFCLLNYDENTALFGVFDGHGGAEVAQYTAANLPEFLKQIKAYQSKDFESALKEAFIEFDKTLVDDNVQKQLKTLCQSNSSSDAEEENEEDIEEENSINLQKEAKIPISELISRYAKKMEKVQGRKSKLLAQKNISKELNKDEDKSSNGNSNDEDEKHDTENKEESSDLINGVDNSEKQDDTDCVAGSSKTSDKSNGNSNKNVSEVDGEVAGPSSSSAHQSILADDEKPGSSSSHAGGPKTFKKATKKQNKPSKLSIYDLLNKDFESDEDDSEDDSEDELDSDQSDIDDEIENNEDEEDEEEEDDDDDEDEEDDDEEDEDDLEASSLSSQMFHVGPEVPGQDSGCTAVVALLHENQLYVANAGDSRCVLSRAGKAVELSFDHKPESKIEFDRIKKAGGFVNDEGRVNAGLNLSRAIGDHSYKQNKKLDMSEQMITALPDIQKTSIGDEDEFMVIACDGIWNSMTSSEVIDFVRSRINKCKLSEICDELFQNCLATNSMGDGTGCDNMTCVIVRFDNSKQIESTNGSADLEKKTQVTESTGGDSSKRSFDEATNGDFENSEKNAKKICNRD